jgi:hypothetical protein
MIVVKLLDSLVGIPRPSALTAFLLFSLTTILAVKTSVVIKKFHQMGFHKDTIYKIAKKLLG